MNNEPDRDPDEVLADVKRGLDDARQRRAKARRLRLDLSRIVEENHVSRDVVAFLRTVLRS